jgi:hypothetical protein
VRLGILFRGSLKVSLDDVVCNIERRTGIVDSTATALHVRRMELHVQGASNYTLEAPNMSDLHAEYKVELERQKRTKLMQWLNPPNMSEYHDRTMRLVADRTCEWILSHNVFVDWQSQLHTSDRRVLITHGRAGCGKSVLSSSIFDMVRDTKQQASERAKNSLLIEDTQQFPVFFAFSATDTSRQTIETFLRSFLAQLIDFDQDNGMISLLSHLAKKSSTSRADILSALLEVLDSVAVTAIVDGIDECSDNPDELFHVLHTLYLKTS